MTDRADKPETLITAKPAMHHYWLELWQFRELLLLLGWRDLIIRYKQTAIGVAWAILRPIVTMVVFTLVFGKLANMPSKDTPYPLLVFAGMLPWMFFATTFNDVGNSIVSNGHIISKVYFPRIIIPLSALLTGLVDFALSAGVYFMIALYYGYMPGWQIIFLPLFVLLLCLIVLGCSLWVSALNVTYRDFRYIVPFVVQFGAYVSPVGFASSVVPERWQLLYAINPMVGVIDGFRWCLLGAAHEPRWDSVGMAALFALIILIPGIRFFRRAENDFADAI
jgi:lipopolysaccharide transport system permease protein